MRRTLVFIAAVLLCALPAMAAVEGAWTASLNENHAGRLHVQLTLGRHSNIGTMMQAGDFTGLAASSIDAATMTPVQFQLRREAGVASFEGTFRKGKGAGQFTFAGNLSYLDTLKSLGVDPRLDREKATPDELLFTLALHDVSTAFIRSMQAEGYRESLDKYLAMRIFDITPEYIREMRSLGFSRMDADELVATRIHKVTPDYVRQMRAAGWNLSLDELQSSRIHKATPEFAEQMKKLGYGNLPFDELVAFRIHKVTPEFISELRELGYRDVDADDLVAMRIHKVTPEFIRELRSAGYENVPVEKLVSMKIHKIDANYLKKMNGKG